MKSDSLRRVFVGLLTLGSLSMMLGLSLARDGPFGAATGRVRLSKVHEAPGNTWLRAFVKTDSDDPRIHATLNECGAHQTAARGKLSDYGLPYLVSAGARNVGGDKGVLITVWFNGPIAPDVEVWVTVTQVGAQLYGQPRRYLRVES